MDTKEKLNTLSEKDLLLEVKETLRDCFVATFQEEANNALSMTFLDGTSFRLQLTKKL